MSIYGPFTHSIGIISVSMSGNGNTNARMGTTPIHFPVLALPLTLTLCVNRFIQHWKTHRAFDANANALCERAITLCVKGPLPSADCVNSA